MATIIDKIAAPNLPLAPEQWDRRYQDQFANVLRLYFNQLDTAVNTQTANIAILQAEIDALTAAVNIANIATQRNQTLIWLDM